MNDSKLTQRGAGPVSYNYITQVMAKTPLGKTVSIKDGAPSKSAPPMPSKAIAQTVPVPDVDAMKAVQQTLADMENMALIGGFIPGTEDGEFYHLWSVKEIEAATGQSYDGGWVEIEGLRVTARLKNNFTPSTWWQIDRDAAKGCPDRLANLDEDAYMDAIDKILPGYAAAACVRVASTTGRVLLDGEPLHSDGCRYWFQVTDAALQDNIGAVLKVKAAAQGLGFLKLDKNDKPALWSIFDPSVFSPERFVFDGKPTVKRHKGRLTIAEPDIRVYYGDRVDPALIGEVTEQEREQVKARFGVTVQGTGAAITLINDDYLALDTKIQTKDHGVKTVLEFAQSGEDKWRCQSTFRESASWNGALKLSGAGMPYLLDYGGGPTRYELPVAEQAALLTTPSGANTEDNPTPDFTPDNLLKLCSMGAFADMDIPDEECIFNGKKGGLATVDIWQVFAPTGHGKTLWSQPLAMAVACGGAFLDWQADKPRRVLYLDGELPASMIKSRGKVFLTPMTDAQQALVRQNMVVLNREVLAATFGVEIPPLDTPAGEKWLLDIVDGLGADLVVFDSRFCLLKADLKETGSMPQTLMRKLRQRHCAQIWLHHTGKDVKKGGYGDKSAEWLLDANLEMVRDSQTDCIKIQFHKKRKAMPENADFYRDRTLELLAGVWRVVDGSDTKRTGETRQRMEALFIHLKALGAADESVPVKSLRVHLVSGGEYDLTDTGKALTKESRNAVYRYLGYLVADGMVTGDNEAGYRIAGGSSGHSAVPGNVASIASARGGKTKK